MSIQAIELSRLRLRLQQDIANDKRARKGSNLTYRHECKEELKLTRDLITKLFCNAKK